MNLLDTRTVILVYAISNLICMIVIAVLWRQNRKRFSGIGFWLADFVLQFLGLLLVLLRGSVPDFLSMTVSNAFIIGGTILLYIGLEYFTGKRTHQIHNYILLVVFVVIHAYFVYFLPNLAFRNILFSLGLLTICAQCAWLMLRWVGAEMQLITRGVGYVFVIFCLVSLVRIFVTIFAPSDNDFFRSNTYDTLLLVTYQMLFIILTFSLSLLVNRHLFVDLKKEFLVRGQTERALSERAKELKCIYDLSSLIQTPGISLDEILPGSVRLLPPAMSYPEFACARLVVSGQSYATENFQDSASKISCEILESGLKIGMLEVCYPKEPPVSRENLFLKEEIELLHDVASQLGRVIERQAFNDAVKKSQESYQVFVHQSFEAIYRTEFDQPIDISLPVETQIDLIYANAYMAECNQAMADMYNFPSTDMLIGARLLDVHGSSDNLINRAAFRKFIEGGYKSTNDETLERDAQGNPVWFLSNTLGIVENGLLVRMWGTSINITERKRAEEALRRRENEFKTLVENSPDAITRFDREGHYQYVNPARAWYFGRTVNEIQGKTWQDLLGPDEVEEGKIADAALKQIFENPKDFTVEYQTKTPDGMRWVQSRGTPEFAEDGSVESVLVVTRDITERKQAEEELRRSEMLLREIAANYPHSFISVIEKDLTVGFTAGQEFRRLNLDPDSFIGLTLEQVFGEHTPLVRENYLKTFGGTESEFELYINNQHQLYRTVPLVNRDGKIDRILSVVENVTERKQMEETLARLASFPELNPQPVVELGLDGNITYLNPAARRVFPDLQGRGKDHPWLSGLEKISEGFLQGAIPATTRELQSGELIYEQTINYVPEYKQVRIYGRDITDHKQMEDALTQSEALFREVFDNIAHGVFIIEVTEDGNFRIGNSNKAEEILTTIHHEDVMGKLLEDAFPPDIAQALHTNYSRCLAAGESIAYEEEVNLPGVGQRFYFTTLAPVRNESGHFYRIIGSTLEITERKQMENALRKSEEEHRTIVQTAMDGFWQLNMQGHIMQVNNAYCRMSGYSEQELMSMKIADLEVVETPDIIAAHMQKVVAQGQNRFETRHRRKDGSLFDIEISVQYRDGRLFAFLRDITESKRAEAIVRLRLQLWEYASRHSVDELMQKALDEISLLTDSPIGFYHFVEEDQNTLSLQAWSTRTLAEFCKAEGRDLHYPINEAGVWVDCVRERKPVIHNDYASLPHRKGMPAGHAKVIRELVVPTMRGDKIFAILGVGNKPADYNEKDVELVSYIADVVWTIVEQKRANERILELNARLEQLAMTDELTGLFNRRSFFQRGAEEVKRSNRYHAPLSLLMMDIDHFKRINDTYGHDAGDRILCCIAEALKRNIREIDTVARLGGEEFGVLLPNTEAKNAFGLAERLRQAVEQATCSTQSPMSGITLSIGVAVFDEKETQNVDHLLKKADTAMYVAKNQGRNRVVMFG